MKLCSRLYLEAEVVKGSAEPQPFVETWARSVQLGWFSLVPCFKRQFNMFAFTLKGVFIREHV